MHIQALPRELVDRKGSDVYITANSPPLIRSEGVTRPIGDHRVAAVNGSEAGPEGAESGEEARPSSQWASPSRSQ